MKFDKIFLVGFPKSGTSTIQKAFVSSGITSVHWEHGEEFVGNLMYQGFEKYDDPWYFLSDFQAITQADVCVFPDTLRKTPSYKPQRLLDFHIKYPTGLNYWPNLDFKIIGKIQDKYPNCLFVLNYREPKKIISSIKRWGDLHHRITISEIPGLGINLGSDEDLMRWLERHFNRVRDYFNSKENFLEFDIENSNAPNILSEKLGIKITWWGIENKSE